VSSVYQVIIASNYKIQRIPLVHYFVPVAGTEAHYLKIKPSLFRLILTNQINVFLWALKLYLVLHIARNNIKYIGVTYRDSFGC